MLRNSKRLALAIGSVCLLSSVGGTSIAQTKGAPKPKIEEAGKPLPSPRTTPVFKPKIAPLTKDVNLKVALPSINSVARVGPPPGPAAGGFLLNGEPISINGYNFGTTGAAPKLGIRIDGKVARLLNNNSFPRSNSEMHSWMPGNAALKAVGIEMPRMRAIGAEIVLLNENGVPYAAHPVRFAMRHGYQDDFDGDGVTVEANDCNDFDSSRYPGHPELPDTAGKDEDCDPMIFGNVDRDGDGFFDAAVYNVDIRNRRIYRGNDCNDADATANPVRPERCPAGSTPAERDAELRRNMGWR